MSLRMSSTTIGEHIRLRRARNQTIRHLDDDPPLTHVVLPISQPNHFCNSAMSSFFLLPTSSNETTKKKPYQTVSFRWLGCTAAAAQEVSLPSVIRSSADWDARIRLDKKKHKKKNKKNKGSYDDDASIKFLSETRDVDVWCGPGLGFSTDAVVGPRRRNLPSSRRNNDVGNNNFNHSEGSSVLPRRFLNQESHSHAFFNSDSTFMTSSRAEPTRFRGFLRRPYPDDLTEMMMLHNGFVMGRITDSRDNFHELRLDVDSMSYEQLLELGDRIGYVNTGLKESEIHRCLGKIKPSISHTLADRKCSICQDEYEGEDEVGKLNCGHSFHVHCVKQWLSRKNACPVCKKTAYVKS
ncbi:putative E3 ubiquitin-protein ligase HIP1 [Cardamine amara subsp. amara]|uniref:RING-type E3 ubiquitin transferase n=1 Tax=Cardamine amara subsp. amara TaxID=228776 RepID=A0ABD1C3K2_CARAN